jgi:HAD superfamily hydrolase (TIGR01509 family)
MRESSAGPARTAPPRPPCPWYRSGTAEVRHWGGMPTCVDHERSRPKILPLHTYAAVLFDMDGTLVDTEPLWADAGRAVLESLAVDLPDSVLERLHGLDLDATLRLLADEYEVHMTPEAFVTPLLDAVEATLVDARSREGAAEWLDAVEAASLPRAIVSNSPRRMVDATLAPQPWSRHLPVRVSVDDVERGKPAPEIYRLAARRLGVDPRSCLALEDSLVGARAAVAAGASCILATFGVLDPVEARSVTPFVVDDLPQALLLVAAAEARA